MLGASPNGGAPHGGLGLPNPGGSILADQGLLGPPSILGAEVGTYGNAVIPLLFGDALVTGGTWVRGRMALANPFGVPSALAWHDYSALLVGLSDLYFMELTGSPAVRIPIASWQATQQIGRSQYLQAVVPGAAAWVDTITERQAAHAEMVIYRSATLTGGLTMLAEMSRCPLRKVRYDRGATNYSATLSGYAAAATAPVHATDAVALHEIRLISIDDNVRVRCAIDWQLRPGMDVSADDQGFEVAYINYYVTGTDAYMDVGDRAP